MQAKITNRRLMLCSKLYKNIENNKNDKLASILPPRKKENSYNLRRSKVYNVPSKTDRFRNSFHEAAKIFKFI